MQFDITTEAVDAVGYIAESNLDQISDTIYFDRATGTIYVQEADQAVKITIAE